MENKRVLVTGVTGFLGAHTTIQLLNKGYEVVGTLRSKNRIHAIKAVIGKHTKNSHHLAFAEADLNDNDIWLKLTKNVDYIQHIASPFPRTMPANEDELITPAKKGTLHILKAASTNQVKRVVMVSSLGSIAYGKTKKELDTTFNENDWTDVSDFKDTTPYYRSKTIAEKVAWDFIKQEKTGLELTTIAREQF